MQKKNRQKGFKYFKNFSLILYIKTLILKPSIDILNLMHTYTTLLCILIQHSYAYSCILTAFLNATYIINFL